jgi:CheY-like chemotaxis protein
MKKILVVDNDKFILEFMNDVLSERGHEVLTAEGQNSLPPGRIAGTSALSFHYPKSLLISS